MLALLNWLKLQRDLGETLANYKFRYCNLGRSSNNYRFLCDPNRFRDTLTLERMTHPCRAMVICRYRIA